MFKHAPAFLFLSAYEIGLFNIVMIYALDWKHTIFQRELCIVCGAWEGLSMSSAQVRHKQTVHKRQRQRKEGSEQEIIIIERIPPKR